MIISKEEYECAKNNQALVHFTFCKPWRNKAPCKFEKKWWFFAGKSGFLSEIITYYFKNKKRKKRKKRRKRRKKRYKLNINT